MLEFITTKYLCESKAHHRACWRIYNDEVWRSSDTNTMYLYPPNIRQRNLIIKSEFWTENVAFVKVDDEDLINNFLAEQGFLFMNKFFMMVKINK